MLKIKRIDGVFAVCKIKDISCIDFSSDFVFLSKTDQEISLVTHEYNIPNNVLTIEKGFKGFRIEQNLDFALVGILAKISSLLAKKGISIFAVSTYNTDYIFTKKESFDSAIELLNGNGYEIV